MSQLIKKSKISTIMLLCFGCLLLGLYTVRLTASAAEKSAYYIKVNKQQNCITVYEKDEKGVYIPIKAMACSTGPATPLGTYNTLIKYRWKLLMGDVWGQYSTRIVKGILFHSVWYYEMDETTLSAKQFNKLGSSASHGCIRITVADAKWIYDNCPIGTTVEIYNDKDPGPLGKPDTMKIKLGTGWDPTDPSIKNPYNDLTPNIKGASNKKIAWGTEVDLVKGVKATSTTGTDISSQLKVSGDVDIYTAGDYKISYVITDAIGRTKKKTITITVKEGNEKPEFKGVVDRSISKDTIVDREFALEGVKAYIATLELEQDDIEVNINQLTEDSYSIEYTIVGPNDITDTTTANVYVDTTAPVMKGITHKDITLKQLESGKSGIEKLALKSITVTDDYTKLSLDQVKVTIKEKSDYAFLVTYKATDNCGNTSTETVQFTYFNDVMIEGVTNHSKLPYGTEITKDYVLQGITATNSDGDCTDLIAVKISGFEDEEYIVTYSIADEDGVELSIVSYFIVEEEPTAIYDTEDENSPITEELDKSLKSQLDEKISDEKE